MARGHLLALGWVSINLRGWLSKQQLDYSRLIALFYLCRATYHQAAETERVLKMLDVPLMQLGPHRYVLQV